MTKFRKSLLIFGLLALIIGAALGTFIVLTVVGSIKSEPIEIEFTVEDAEQEYNGEALKASSYYISDGRLIVGHTPVVTFTGEQIDVGDGSSGLDVRIVDENGYDVTDEYSIKVNGGKLTVTLNSIVVKLNDREIVYGGSAFSISEDDFDVVDGVLPQGHRVSLKIKDEWLENINNWSGGSKSLTANDADIMIFDNNGRNVSKNYYSSLSGNVRIVKRPITLSPLSAEKTYDGRDLVCSQYNVSKGSLATGHYIEPVFKSVDGGLASVRYANDDSPLRVLVDAQIYDADDNNVTQFYDIASEEATLTVHKANLTLVAKSISREYDGSVLTLSSDSEVGQAIGLVSGDDVTVEYSGEVEGIGTAQSVIESFTVSNNGNGNYNVTKQNGTLEVTKANLAITLKDMTKEYNGLPFYKKGAASTEADHSDLTDFYTVADLPVGFKLSDCTLDGILEESELCNTTYNLKSCVIADTDGKDVTDYFNVSSKPAVCRINRCAVELESTALSKEYDGDFTFSSGLNFKNNKLVSVHTFRSFTVEAFTPNVTVEEKKTTKSVGVTSFSLVDSLGRDAIGYYDIKNLNTFKVSVTITPKALTISTPDYNKEYDGIAVGGGDITYGLLAPTDRLVVTEAVSEINYTGEDGVKNEPVFAIYNNKNEDVTGFYDLDENYGTIKISRKSLLVSLEYREIEYSGTPLKDTALFKYIRCDGISPENFKVTIEGESVTIGEKTVEISWMNDDETFKNNFSLSYGNTTFAIVKRKLSLPINTAYAQKYYDGQPLRRADMKINFIDMEGVDMSSIDVSNLACTSLSIEGEVDAMTYPETTIVFENSTDQITATGNYVINTAHVKIKYNEAATKTYDGKPYEFDTNLFTVFNSVGKAELSALKVRDYRADSASANVTENENAKVTINGVTIVNAATGEVISSNNVVYEQSEVSVTISRRQLTFNIDVTNMKDGGDYDPQTVITVSGLVENHRIEYLDAEERVYANYGYAYFELVNFEIYNEANQPVTQNYLITQSELRVPY